MTEWTLFHPLYALIRLNLSVVIVAFSCPEDKLSYKLNMALIIAIADFLTLFSWIFTVQKI